MVVIMVIVVGIGVVGVVVGVRVDSSCSDDER